MVDHPRSKRKCDIFWKLKLVQDYYMFNKKGSLDLV